MLFRSISKWVDTQLSWLVRSDDGGTGHWEFFYSTDGTSYVQVTGSNIKDGQWHHIVFTQSTGANKTFRLFVDGILRGYVVEANWTQGAATSNIYFGYQGPGTYAEVNRYFTGALSNLRISTQIISTYSTTSTTLGTAVFSVPTTDLRSEEHTSELQSH